MSENESLLNPNLRRIRAAAWIAGGTTLIICLAGALFNPRQFFHSYLTGYLLLLGTTLGAMGLVMLYHLTSGYWGLIMRRILESASRTMPLMAILTIPLLFGMPELYVWAREGAAQADPLLREKEFYLTVSLFIIRQVVYLTVWLSLSYYMNRWSSLQDSGQNSAALGKLRALSAAGLVLYGITVTFASVDWIMSLQPHYYSTTFGFRLITGQAVNGLAFGVLASLLLSSREPIASLIDLKRLRDLGNLMLASILLWAYVAFTEFLIVWAGNLPHETVWFRERFYAGWGNLAWFLLSLHFFIPFLLLLQRRVKHRPMLLAMIAAWLLLMRWLDLFWMITPSLHPTLALHWMDIFLPAGMSGLWLAVFLWQLAKKPIVPAYDPLYLERPNERHAAPA